MKLAEKQNNASGRLPEFGAIFMSNSATKKECFRRKLFGLSHTAGNFVKQIKAGMILFLFEHERRELYGVFQASSDGSMNIVPQAFRSTGMHYPAQVKFKTIWFCDPLSENEFYDAIKENYFSSQKFNFGLSEAQVRRLLQLFSLRKLGDPIPEHRLTKSIDVKSMLPSMDKVRHADSSRPNVKHRINGEYVSGNSNVDIELRPATTDEYPLLDKVERDNNKFTTCGWEIKDYGLDSELGSAISPRYSKYHDGDVRRVLGDGGFLMIQSESNKDNGFEPAVPNEYPSLLQSNLHRSVFPSKSLLTNSLVPDQSMPYSSVHHHMESELISNLSSKASYRDAVVTSTRPYDSDAPGLSYQRPSTNVVNCSSTAEGGRPYYDYAENLISSSRKESFFSYPEPKGLNTCLDKISTYGDYVSFSGPNCNDSLHNGTGLGLSQAAYSKNLDADILKHQCFTGLSSSKYSLADVPSLGTRTNIRENKFSSRDPLIPNVNSSLVDNHGYQIEPEDQLQHQTAWRKRNEALEGDIALSYEGPLTLQPFGSSVDPQSLQHYEHNSFRYDLKHHQSSDTLDSGQKSRLSVFSRLALAPDVYLPEHSADGGYEVHDTSTLVDGIMETLHKNHHQWAKLKKPKQGNRQDDVRKLIRKKQTTIYSKAELEADCSKTLLEDTEVDFSLNGKEKATHLTEAKPFLNFKRRSELRKLHNNEITTKCSGSSANEGFSGGQQKKRKLIRPNFSKNASSDDKGMKDCTTLPAPSKEIYLTKDNTEGCRASIGTQVNENKISFPSVKEPQLVQGDVDFDIESRETRIQTSVLSLRNGGEVGKESLNNTSIQNATNPGSCAENNPHGRKDSYSHDSMVGLSQGYHLTSHSFVQETFLGEPKEKCETGDGSAKSECERNNKVELIPSAQSVGETCPANAHHTTFNSPDSSSIRVSELQRESEEHSATCVDASKENEQQMSSGSNSKPSKQSFDKPELCHGVRKKIKRKRCTKMIRNQ